MVVPQSVMAQEFCKIYIGTNWNRNYARKSSVQSKMRKEYFSVTQSAEAQENGNRKWLSGLELYCKKTIDSH